MPGFTNRALPLDGRPAHHGAVVPRPGSEGAYRSEVQGIETGGAEGDADEDPLQPDRKIRVSRDSAGQ